MWGRDEGGSCRSSGVESWGGCASSSARFDPGAIGGSRIGGLIGWHSGGWVGWKGGDAHSGWVANDRTWESGGCTVGGAGILGGSRSRDYGRGGGRSGGDLACNVEGEGVLEDVRVRVKADLEAVGSELRIRDGDPGELS